MNTSTGKMRAVCDDHAVKGRGVLTDNGMVIADRGFKTPNSMFK
jgi:hypothetical protein